MMFRVVAVLGFAMISMANGPVGCGDFPISMLFSRLGMNEQQEISATESINSVLRDSGKTPQDIKQIVTKDEFDREGHLGLTPEVGAMGDGERLDVLRGPELTKILIRFNDGSFQVVRINYAKPRRSLGG